MSEKHIFSTKVETSKLLRTIEESTAQIRTSEIGDEDITLHFTQYHRGYQDAVRAIQYIMETLDPTNAEQVKAFKEGLSDYLKFI